MPVVEYAPADPQHHRSVPPYQDSERSFLLPADESLQQLAIRQLLKSLCAQQFVDVPQDIAQLAVRHVLDSPRDSAATTLLQPRKEGLVTTFCREFREFALDATVLWHNYFAEQALHIPEPWPSYGGRTTTHNRADGLGNLYRC